MILAEESLFLENLYDSACFFSTLDDSSLSLGVSDVHEFNISKLFLQHVEYRVVGLESHADAAVVELNFFDGSVRILYYEAVRLYFLQSCGRSLVYVVLIHQINNADLCDRIECRSDDIRQHLDYRGVRSSRREELHYIESYGAGADNNDLLAVLDDPSFSSLISGVYEDGGYHLLGIADQGFRVMSTNKAVRSMVDFKGQKIRTMENPYHLAFWKSIGANPTPMSFSEVYIGLQQHTIDAQENPYEVIVSNRLYEQQDYVVETNHLPHLITLIMNDEFFNDMPSEDQKIMQEAAQTATEYARQASDDRIADRVKTIEDSGTEIITVNEKTHNELVEASSSVRESIEKAVDPAIYKAYIK